MEQFYIILPKKFLKRPSDHAIQNNLPFSSEVSRDELWILQTLLSCGDWSSLARKHLKPEELNSPHLREIYKALLRYPLEAFDPFDPRMLEREDPELYQAVIALSIEDVPQHEFLLSLKRIKERNLHAEFQEQRSQGSHQERLQAGIKYRRKIGELKSLMANLSVT